MHRRVQLQLALFFETLADFRFDSRHDGGRYHRFSDRMMVETMALGDGLHL